MFSEKIRPTAAATQQLHLTSSKSVVKFECEISADSQNEYQGNVFHYAAAATLNAAARSSRPSYSARPVITPSTPSRWCSAST